MLLFLSAIAVALLSILALFYLVAPLMLYWIYGRLGDIYKVLAAEQQQRARAQPQPEARSDDRVPSFRTF